LMIASIPIILIDRDNIVWSNVNWYRYFCISLSVIGIFIRAVSIRKKDEPKKLGIYSILKYPMFVGKFLMWGGVFAYIGSIGAIFIYVLLSYLIYDRAFVKREKTIKTLDRLREFNINFKLWEPIKEKFSLRYVLKKDYKNILFVYCSFVTISLTKNYAFYKEIAPQIFWFYFLGITIIFFVIIYLIYKIISLDNITVKH